MNLMISRPKNPISTLVFAHGAGAPMSSEWMTTVANLFSERDIKVIRFNFPYMERRFAENKKFPPDRMPKLLKHLEEVIFSCYSQGEVEGDLFLGGKSMGSRVCTSSEILETKGIICFGFPFCPPGKEDTSRIETLNNSVHSKILINQGERDPFGKKEWLKNQKLKENIRLDFYYDGDHDLKPRKKSGKTIQENLTEAVDASVRFIKSII